MNSSISGSTMQTVHISLSPGESVYCQTHAMAWMSDDVKMDTNTRGGFLSGIARSISGGSFFVTTYTAAGRSDSKVVFAAKFPGHVMPVTLAPGQSVLCRKEAFLVAQSSVTFEIAFQQRFGAGLLGGDGFILQKLTGPGTVWLDLSGEVCVEELAPNQKLLVHAGHVGIFDPAIQFSIQRVGGIKNMLFGGEGLFLASLIGPGKVYLQSMPIMNLAEALSPYLSRGDSSAGENTASGVIGGLVGGLLRGR